MANGTKSILMGAFIIIGGALLGSFLGGFVGHTFPDGVIYDLFSKEISAGLQTTTLDLRVMELTFGCVLKFNVPSVLGIFIAAYMYKSIFK